LLGLDCCLLDDYRIVINFIAGLLITVISVIGNCALQNAVLHTLKHLKTWVGFNVINTDSGLNP
jgi:hypothetical protein